MVSTTAQPPAPPGLGGGLCGPDGCLGDTTTTKAAAPTTTTSPTTSGLSVGVNVAFDGVNITALEEMPKLKTKVLADIKEQIAETLMAGDPEGIVVSVSGINMQKNVKVDMDLMAKDQSSQSALVAKVNNMAGEGLVCAAVLGKVQKVPGIENAMKDGWAGPLKCTQTAVAFPKGTTSTASDKLSPSPSGTTSGMPLHFNLEIGGLNFSNMSLEEKNIASGIVEQSVITAFDKPDSHVTAKLYDPFAGLPLIPGAVGLHLGRQAKASRKAASTTTGVTKVDLSVDADDAAEHSLLRGKMGHAMEGMKKSIAQNLRANKLGSNLTITHYVEGETPSAPGPAMPIPPSLPKGMSGQWQQPEEYEIRFVIGNDPETWKGDIFPYAVAEYMSSLAATPAWRGAALKEFMKHYGLPASAPLPPAVVSSEIKALPTINPDVRAVFEAEKKKATKSLSKEEEDNVVIVLDPSATTAEPVGQFKPMQSSYPTATPPIQKPEGGCRGTFCLDGRGSEVSFTPEGGVEKVAQQSIDPSGAEYEKHAKDRSAELVLASSGTSAVHH